MGWAPLRLYHGLKDWKTLDPEAAALAMSRSEETRNLAENLKQAPMTENTLDQNVLPPLSDDTPPAKEEP